MMTKSKKLAAILCLAALCMGLSPCVFAESEGNFVIPPGTAVIEADKNIGFNYGNARVVFEDGKINVYKHGRIIAQNTVESFSHSPNTVFRQLQEHLIVANDT